MIGDDFSGEVVDEAVAGYDFFKLAQLILDKDVESYLKIYALSQIHQKGFLPMFVGVFDKINVEELAQIYNKVLGLSYIKPMSQPSLAQAIISDICNRLSAFYFDEAVDERLCDFYKSVCTDNKTAIEEPFKRKAKTVLLRVAYVMSMKSNFNNLASDKTIYPINDEVLIRLLVSAKEKNYLEKILSKGPLDLADDKRVQLIRNLLATDRTKYIKLYLDNSGSDFDSSMRTTLSEVVARQDIKQLKFLLKNYDIKHDAPLITDIICESIDREIDIRILAALLSYADILPGFQLFTRLMVNESKGKKINYANFAVLLLHKNYSSIQPYSYIFSHFDRDSVEQAFKNSAEMRSIAEKNDKEPLQFIANVNLLAKKNSKSKGTKEKLNIEKFKNIFQKSKQSSDKAA